MFRKVGKDFYTIFKNFFYNLSYQIFSLILPIITVPYITKVFSQELIGLNSVIQANCSYFVLIGMLGIGFYGPCEIAKYQGDSSRLSESFWKIFRIQLISHMISSMIYLIFCFGVVKNNIAYIYILYLIASAFDISWFYMGIEDFKSVSIRNLFVKLVSFGLLFLLVKNEQDIYMYICTLYIPQILINIYMWIRLIQLDLISIKVRRISGNRRMLREIVVLFFPQLASSIYTILDKTVLGIFTTYAVVAIYEQGQILLRLFIAVIPSFSKVMMPRISNSIQKDDKAETMKYMKMSAKIVTFISFLLFWGVIACAEMFVEWYLPANYRNSADVIKICSPIILFVSGSNLISIQYLIPIGEQKKYSFSIFVAAIINMILNFLLTPFYGIYGVCIGSIIAEGVGFALQLWYVREYLDIKVLFDDIYIYILSGFIMCIYCVKMVNCMSSTLLHLVVIAGSGAIIYFVFVIILHKFRFKIGFIR